MRSALLAWIDRHELDARQARKLFALAGLDDEPPALARRLWPTLAVVGAALGGFGLVLWIAANWSELGRAGRFTLLQAALGVFCLGAALLPRARQALGLLAFLSLGALFAYFGQTYQTGADPWQLFALWALLGLPLALGVRSDVVWAPLALVAAVGVALWVQVHTGHRWRVEPQDLRVYTIGWCVLLLLVALLGPWARRWTGAGPWSVRSAGMLAVLMIGASGLAGLFHRTVAPQYWLALGLCGAAAVLLTRRGWREVFLLSALALTLDTLIVGGLARWLFLRGPLGDGALSLLLLGLVAAGLLAFSVTTILKLVREGD